MSQLYRRVREILDAIRARVACSVNHEQGQSHRLIGETIVTHEQQGKATRRLRRAVDRIISRKDARRRYKGLF